MRTRRLRRPQAGVTLIELIVVMAMMVVLTAALSYGFAASVDMQRRHTARLQEHDQAAAMEDRITTLLQGAKLSETTTDTHTYFEGTIGNTGPTGTSGASTTSTLNSSSANNNSTIGGTGGADHLTFTTTAPGIPDAARYSQDDFETQHNARGPIGGTTEVSISTTPVGTPTDSQASGLFLRIQRPSDGDTTQGGTESLLLPGVTQISFEFWDGLEWASTWDTAATVHRLPAAVQISYVLESDGKNAAPRIFVVPIPASDIDTQDPAAGAGGAATTL